MEELWKDIENYKGYYQISNFGRVRRLKKNRDENIFLHLNNDSYGYYIVTLSKHNKRASKTIHRLVAHAFVAGFSKENSIVNHKDKNKKNNIWTNLEWCNNVFNRRHSSKLSSLNIEEIKKSFEDGETQTAIGRRFGVKANTISRIINGKRWNPHLLATVASGEVLTDEEK